ncbi:MAG TPA: MG2 domain-containing protein, partial [Pyrinomonadaceae bacterium]
MSRRWLLFLFCLSLLSLVAPLSRANLSVRIDDAAITVRFDEQGTRVVLPVENALPQTLDARVKLELLETDGAIRAPVAHDYQLKSGRNELTIPLALWLSGKAATDTSELLWYRLRYEITPRLSSQFDTVSNVISLSEITPDIFKLNVATSRKAREGSAYRLRVRTAHPLNSRPVAAVAISAELKFDGYDRDDIVLKQSARSDSAGFATLDFQIPRDVEDDEGDLTVTGQRGILNVSAESDVEINRDTQIMVTSDKPLYQPGQMLHLRVLMFDSSRRALADQKVSLKVLDPESSTTFRAQLTSSRFGVASADWQIPENARLGDYRVEVELDSDKYEDAYGGMTVKISRYDLPNFTVNVTPNRPFYLSGQNADVEVRADYLFGQPVKRGHVRVVRETERHWNYREQKYETEEGDKYEGDTDSEGKFVARINLSEEHKKLKEEDYSRYTDLTFAAYFTDPTTNRTEQRRFDLRLTKDAIHIYPIISGSRQAPDLPLDFYVSASYADGTPASCEVAISRVWNEDERRPAVALRTVRTNRYGLAKMSALMLPKGDDDESEAQLQFRARDDRNATGVQVESLSLSARTRIHITTNKPLFRDGEPIRAQIVSNKADLMLALDAITDEKVVQSKLVTLTNGRASIEIPFRREFTGAVTLAAYAPSETEDQDEFVYHTRTVLYPHDRDLKLNLTLDQDSYRPGQNAIARFLTRSATGASAESSLGVVIFDKAVEERARTDREFGGDNFYGPYRYLSNDLGSIAGLSRKDLDRLDLSKPLPEGIDLVAEVMLTNYVFEPRFFQGDRYESDAAAIFRDFFEYQIDPLKGRLDAEYKENWSYPTNEEALRRVALIAGLPFDGLRDPWEMPYRADFFAQHASDVLQMKSAGPDKQFETDDDFTVLRLERPYFHFAGEAINRAVARYHRRTGKFIRDAATLKTELRQEAIDFDSLRDPWGEPYRLDFGVSQTRFQVFVTSSGRDRRFATKSNDDVPLWTSSIDYSIDLQAKIDAALVTHVNKSSQLPQNDSDFRLALQQSGIARDDLLDPWGHPYYVTFKQVSVYGDNVRVYSYANYGEKPQQKVDVTPVTRYLSQIHFRSAGEDGKEGTADDFNVATFSRLNAEQAGSESAPQPQQREVILPGSTGAITGTVTDPQGAVIPGAKVTAKNLRNSIERTAETNENGLYLIKNLSAGTYEVIFDAPAFNRAVVTNVVVRSSNITQLNVTLEVGTVSQTVTVTGESAVVDVSNSTTSMMISGQRNMSALALLAPGVSQQLSTPRLREYFPETLVWQPSLKTDKRGRAQLQFKLADNITTW